MYNLAQHIFRLIIATYISVVLFSYNATDNSFNVIGQHTTNNISGALGAYIADILLNSIGVVNVVLIALIIIPNKSNTKWYFKVLAQLILLASISSQLTIVPVHNKWLWDSYGGAVGLVFQSLLVPYLGEAGFMLLSFAITLTSMCYLLNFNGSTTTTNTCQDNDINNICDIENASNINTISDIESAINTTEDIKDMYDTEGISHIESNSDIYSNSDIESNSDIYSNSDIESKSHDSTSAKSTQSDIHSIKKNNYGSCIKAEGFKNKNYTQKFSLPDLALLEKKEATVKNTSHNLERSQMLHQILSEFGVEGEVIKISHGPVVTLYELRPAAGIKSSRIIGLASDIARSMSALSARIAVIPGRNALGIELPNDERETVLLRELLESLEYSNSNFKLPIALGDSISGKPLVVDLSKMPHLLVAGTTGSGKSVAINSMILSLLYKLTPEQCKFIMIDPKMLELSAYDNIPHLLSPVVTDPKKAVLSLQWVVKEMENRYRLMSSLSVRNVEGFNKKIAKALADNTTLERSVQTGFDPETGAPIFEKFTIELKSMPFIVVVVDEMADLMLVAGKDIELSIQRLAQMARAAGIHIIMATQRPSVDVITGVIKANFPTRISFSVTSKIDSRTILGEQGAEQLLGMGDMLYMSSGGIIKRVHGPFVSDLEVQEVANHLRSQGEPAYLQQPFDDISADMDGYNDDDELYNEALEIIKRDQKVSISYIQRQLRIGYNRAANIVEQMEAKGVITPPSSTGRREILI